MELEIALKSPVPAESVEQLRGLLAYCDPAILTLDLSRAREGVVALEVEDSADREAVSRKVRKVVERLVGPGQAPPQQVFQRLEGSPRWHRGLEAELCRLRAVVPLGGGTYGLLGLAAGLLRAFDEDFREMSVALGSQEAKFPALLSLEFLSRIDYFNSFPHYTTFASHLRPDVEVLDSFMARMRPHRGPLSLGSEEAAPCSMILSPTVCYHLYEALQDTAIPAGGLRVTALGTCCRWEGRNLAHLRRLWEFQMRETVFLGSKEMVVGEREKVLQATLEYCRALGLKAWVENANDPFFSADAGTRNFFQRGFGLKLELRLPYAAAGDSLAAASFNNMQRTFGDGCKISLADGAPAFSGCVGWGLERWVYAFMAQHGTDPAGWPERMRRRFQEKARPKAKGRKPRRSK